MTPPKNSKLSDFAHVLKNATPEPPNTPPHPPHEAGLTLAGFGQGARSKYISPDANAQDCVHRHFERQAALRPQEVAIHFEGEDWTYEKLNRHSDQLAARLQSMGVGPEVLVGVYLNRSPWLFVAILATLKAGGAYVPFDPAFPAERLQMIGEDAEIRILLSENDLIGQLAMPDTLAVSLDGDDGLFSETTPAPVLSEVNSDNLAYVICTSGSTGRPKGVQIRHRSAVNLLLSMAAEPGFGPDDSLLAITTISFDLSIPEVFLAFVTGGRMVLAPKGVGADGEGFAAMLDEHRITFVQGTPTTWRLVLAAGWRGKKDLKVVIGGEAVDRDLVAKLLPLCGELWNFYGPTETTVWSTCLRMREREGPVVVGRALPGNNIYVLDEKLRPVAPGASGEICIGGDGVARGYVNRPDLTKEKFVPDPFSARAGALMYRTGDLGRWHEDGMLECQGRADHQVKVRGYRIELGEIESVLKEHPAVRDSVVVVHVPAPGDQRLAAYVIPEGDGPSDESLRHHLQGRLPDYMIPSIFEMMESFPMTPNQKIDRNALSQFKPVSLPDTGGIPDLTGTPTEIIAEIWRRILGVPVVSAHDNVFKLGAHSLHVAKVHAALKGRFSKRITVAQIFQHPTPLSLAGYFDSERPGFAPKSRKAKKVSARGMSDEDIAIIGMSARFAGARDLDQYWENIRGGVESIRDFSEEQLLAKGVSPELLADKRYVRRGCVLDDYDHFDAGFFEMSPREAELTNPQHRVFLQAAWEALEHAGYVPSAFEECIGLYAGAGHNSYAHASQDLSGSEYLQYLVGNEQDYLTTRAAYKLGLNGPAVNIQTACSTSLVAIHAACQSLLDGECEMALAGGVSISWPEGRGYLYEEGLIFSPDGVCRAFDAKAAGTVFGHGVGVVTLKTLERAKADGDTIHAVIRGIAINNDGNRKGSFAAPSIDGQAEVIVSALARQNIHPESIGLIEAHGTGTSVGDPIEIAGLTSAYRQWTDRKQFCALGSVKNNIGHTDAAAGVAGLLKVALALKNRELPPILHYETPNPDLDLESSPFYIQTSLAEWPGGAKRRAAVSSFGLGGTNAHAVLEEFIDEGSNAVSRPYQLLTCSARSRGSLNELALKWKSHLRRHPDLHLPDAAYTLHCGRAVFDHRGYVVAGSTADALSQLETGSLTVNAAPVMEREVVFLFTGQGAQYPGMARATYFTEAVFSRELDRCSEILEPVLGMRLIDALYPEEGSPPIDLNQTSLAQPALFAISYAQAKLWMSWGVKPASMIGHSIGEYVAAVLSGVFSLEDGLRLVAERGRLMQSMEPGSMLAVMASQEEVGRLLSSHQALDLAASNSPELSVVAGRSEAIAAFAEDLAKQGILTRELHTSHAFHSRMMDGILEEFVTVVSTFKRNAPTIPYLSNVTGEWITENQAVDPAYYADHIRRTVNFSKGVRELLKQPKRLFLEMGPGRTLASLVSKHFDGASGPLALATIPSAQDVESSSRFLMESLGRSWSSGLEIDWKAFHADESRRRVPLPTYAFDEQRYAMDRSDTNSVQSSPVGKNIDLSEWFHAPGWRQRPASPLESDFVGSKTWLILGSAPDALLASIRNRLHPLVLVHEGPEFKSSDNGTYAIRPGSSGDFLALFTTLKNQDRLPDQILIAWTCSEEIFRPTAAAIDDGRVKTLETMHALASAWSRQAAGKPLTVHFLTQKCHDVLGIEPAKPQWSFLTSSCLVVTQEFPAIRCRQVDFDQLDQTLADSVIADCLAADLEPCVAWRNGRRWVRDYPSIKVPAHSNNEALILRQGGVYLITGGLGRVGLLFAKHLVSRVGARIIVLGRRTLPPREEWEKSTDPKLAELLELEKLGTEFLYLAADIGSLPEVASAISLAKKRFGSIHGVIHAAGIVSSQPVLDGSPEELRELTHAKTLGTLAIYQEFDGGDLDFCLLTSSLSSILGGLGYHAYAAGNVFLDQFARWANHTSTFPWISINWDAWKFPDDNSSGLGSAMYRLAMTPGESVEILDRILSHPEIGKHGLVISTSPLAARIEQWIHQPAKRGSGRLENRTGDGPAVTPLERMLAIWKGCLRRDVAPDDNYFDLGGDSLLAVGMFTEIEKQFGQALPMSSLFNSPTPARLLGLVAEEPSIAAEEGIKATDQGLPSHFIAIRETGNKQPIFCIHGADGGVMFYREFALRLDENRPFYAVEAPMLQDLRLNALGSIPEIAREYLREIRRIQPEGPYLLGGYSFGGLVAYEMAQQLKSIGIATSKLLLFDTPNPASPVRRFTLPERIQEQWKSQGEGHLTWKIFGMGKRVIEGLHFRLNYENENRRAVSGRAGKGDHLRHVQSRQQHDLLFDSYQPLPYDGPASLFIAEAGGGDKFAYEENLGWNGYLMGPLDIAEIPGSHLEIFKDPNLERLLVSAREFIPDEP